MDHDIATPGTLAWAEFRTIRALVGWDKITTRSAPRVGMVAQVRLLSGPWGPRPHQITVEVLLPEIYRKPGQPDATGPFDIRFSTVKVLDQDIDALIQSGIEKQAAKDAQLTDAKQQIEQLRGDLGVTTYANNNDTYIPVGDAHRIATLLRTGTIGENPLPMPERPKTFVTGERYAVSHAKHMGRSQHIYSHTVPSIGDDPNPWLMMSRPDDPARLLPRQPSTVHSTWADWEQWQAASEAVYAEIKDVMPPRARLRYGMVRMPATVAAELLHQAARTAQSLSGPTRPDTSLLLD